MAEGASSLRKTQNSRLIPPDEMPQSQMLQTIILHIERLGDRMENTDTKIEELRAKFESADQNRQKLADDISSVKNEISSVKSEISIVKASVESGKNPPWYMGPIPMMVIVGLAFLAGGGFCILILSQLDFVEPLLKMKGLVTNE